MNESKKLHAVLVVLVSATGIVACSNSSPETEAVGQTDGVSISPDQRWVVYRADDGEIHVRPNPDRDLPLNELGGLRYRAAFSPDGRLLVYQTEDGEIVVRPYAGPEPDTEQVLDVRD